MVIDNTHYASAFYHMELYINIYRNIVAHCNVSIRG